MTWMAAGAQFLILEMTVSRPRCIWQTSFVALTVVHIRPASCRVGRWRRRGEEAAAEVGVEEKQVCPLQVSLMPSPPGDDVCRIHYFLYCTCMAQ